MADTKAPVLGKVIPIGIAKGKKKSTCGFSIIEYSGLKDGTVLQPGEQFSRAFTILNNAPEAPKEKTRRVTKLVHAGGELLKDQLFFLWPVPGKTVTITLDLVAPNKPGWYESYWTLDGKDEKTFWVKFEVSGKDNAETQYSKSTNDAESSYKESFCSDTSEEGDAFSLAKVQVRSTLKKKSKKIKRMSLRRKKPQENAHSHAFHSLTRGQSEELKRQLFGGNGSPEFSATSGNIPPYDIPLRNRSQSQPKVPHTSSEKDLTETQPIGVRKLRKPKEKKNQAKTQTEQIEPVVLRSQFRKHSADEDQVFRLNGKMPKETLSNQWQEKAMNDHTKKLSRTQKEKKKRSIERSLSLKNVHNRQKHRIMESLLPSAATVEANVTLTKDISIKRPKFAAIRSVSTHQRAPALQPDTTILTKLLGKIDELLDVSRELEEDLERTKREFHMDPALNTLNEDCKLQINDLFANFTEIRERLQTKVNTAPHIYHVQSLPAELWVKIFSFLSVGDLGKIAQVCSFWRHLSQDDSLWKKRYKNLDLPKISDNSRFIVNEFRFKALYRTEIEFSPWFKEGENSIADSKALMDSPSEDWPIYDLGVTEDLTTAVTVSDCVRVFDFNQRKIVATLDEHEKISHCIKIAKGSQACITGSLDKTVKIWSLSTYECFTTLIGHTGAIKDVHQMEDVIISTSMQDKTVRFWNPVTGENIHTIESKDGVTCLAMSQTHPSNHLYFGTVGGKVTQWDVEAQVSIFSRKITTGMVEGLNIFGDIIAASDFTRITLASKDDPGLECLSPMMSKSVGKLRYDGYRLAAQVGGKLDIFDIRYLFSRFGEVVVDNQWKGAFHFTGDDVTIGSGSGKLYNWKPS